MASNKQKQLLILFLLPLAYFLALAPQTALGFDWPAGAALAQRLQVLEQEIANAKTLVLKSQSKKPITAASYLAVDLGSNEVLLKKIPEKAYPIASVTKLMNAVVARENIDSKKTVTLTRKMLAPEGNSPAIFLGLNIGVNDLLRAALIQSVNDAAESLAESLGKEKFLELMNKKARELGMVNTAYFDVSGLNDKNRSTAADLTKLLAYIYKNHPEILEITRDDNFWLPDQKGILLKFQNMNNFYNFAGFIGGKTGYTPAARQTFAAIFDIKGKPVAVVILHSADFQADTFKIINQLKK